MNDSRFGALEVVCAGIVAVLDHPRHDDDTVFQCGDFLPMGFAGLAPADHLRHVVILLERQLDKPLAFAARPVFVRVLGQLRDGGAYGGTPSVAGGVEHVVQTQVGGFAFHERTGFGCLEDAAVVHRTDARHGNLLAAPK